MGQRSFWEPKTVLVTGAGPIGLLAALGASLRGVEVHVLDRVETGLKPEVVRALGATYHAGSVLDLGFEPDVIVECTGVGAVIADSIQKIGAGGIVCLTGVGAGGVASRAVADIAAAAVLKNNVDSRQRECEQASLVQGGASAGSRRPGVAEPADHAPRTAGEFQTGSGEKTRRHQSRHSVCGGVTGL